MQVPNLRLVVPTRPFRTLGKTSFMPSAVRCFQALTWFGWMTPATVNGAGDGYNP